MAEDNLTSCETFLEYHGTAGATKDCAEAVERLLYMGAPIQTALIITCRKSPTPSHALLLTDTYGAQIVIKSGFCSGYGGAGPKGFSATLALLDWHEIELDEVVVDQGLLDRLDASALTLPDLSCILATRRVRPKELWEYVLDADERPREENPWLRRKSIVPLTMIDDRLSIAARHFWNDPDATLMKAHRQLEEVIRKRIGISVQEASEGPAATYRQAFNGNNPRLTWPGISMSEHAGRANLFMGVLSAYRHVRAHRTGSGRAEDQLSELLLLNHIYKLEAAAVSSTEQVMSGQS